MKVSELINRLQDLANKIGDREVRLQITNHPDVHTTHVTGGIKSVSKLDSIYINAEGDYGDS